MQGWYYNIPTVATAYWVQAVDADGNEITQDVTIPVEDIEPEPIVLSTDPDTIDSNILTPSDDLIDGNELDTLNAGILLLMLQQRIMIL